MVHYYDSISDELRDWALQQQVFFIASAPLNGNHVNLSPKGLPASTLHVFDKNNVGYIDATGSGIETVSHIYENGRATVMFCSFDKSPRIMRWFCKGKVVEWDDAGFDKLLGKMGKQKIIGTRAVILLHVWKGKWLQFAAPEHGKADLDHAVQTSCGYAVPLVSSNLDASKIDQGPRAYLEDRKTLGHWAGQQVEKGTLHAYHQKMNARSLDGCAGLKAARKANHENMLLEDCWIRLKRHRQQWESMLLGAIIALSLMVLMRAGIDALGMRVPTSIRYLM